MNGRFLMLVAMLRKIINDMVLIISFWMSGAVYLFVFSLAKKTIAHLTEKVNGASEKSYYQLHYINSTLEELNLDALNI